MLPDQWAPLNAFVDVADKAVLEVGCGMLTQASEVLHYGGQYTGVDQRRDVILYNLSQGNHGRYILGPAEKVSRLLARCRFSVILSIYGALQFGNAPKILREVRRVSVPNTELLMAGRHPVLQREIIGVDQNDIPSLREYMVGRSSEQVIRMNIAYREGWERIMRECGWTPIAYDELADSSGPISLIIRARIGAP